jgi:hypothetical protein
MLMSMSSIAPSTIIGHVLAVRAMHDRRRHGANADSGGTSGPGSAG